MIFRFRVNGLDQTGVEETGSGCGPAPSLTQYGGSLAANPAPLTLLADPRSPVALPHPTPATHDLLLLFVCNNDHTTKCKAH